MFIAGERAHMSGDATTEGTGDPTECTGVSDTAQEQDPTHKWTLYWRAIAILDLQDGERLDAVDALFRVSYGLGASNGHDLLQELIQATESQDTDRIRNTLHAIMKAAELENAYVDD
jgi:hypothetical protein